MNIDEPLAALRETLERTRQAQQETEKLLNRLERKLRELRRINSSKGQIGRALASFRKTRAGGRPKVLRKCPRCGLRLGAREMREHLCQ